MGKYLTTTKTRNLADLGGGFIQAGTGAVQRTIKSKMQDVVSVKDFGAVGNGVTDDTAAIQAALTAADSVLFPTGSYLITGDLDSILSGKEIYGSGSIVYGGFTYPVERLESLSHLWAGQFKYWPMGHAATTSTVERIQIPAGVTVARDNYSSGCTLYHVTGTHIEDALRVQRNATNASTDYCSITLNLSEAESQVLVGNDVVLQFHCQAAPDFSGGTVTAQILYSVEQEQAIVNPEGRYSSGNVTAATTNITPSDRPRLAPFWITASIPSDATQIAVRFVVPFTGTAGTEDAVIIENASLCIGSKPVQSILADHGSVVTSGRTRYQSSYPYGVPRGSSTSQGNVIGIANGTAASWAFAINIPFSPPMLGPPRFKFQNRFSGTESRFWNEDAAASVNGLAYDLSSTGVVITNNAAAVDGNRYSTNWTAEVIF